MRLLLDTHVFLWFILAPSQLSSDALAAIQTAENTIYLSRAERPRTSVLGM